MPAPETFADHLVIWIIAFFTLSLFSFLYKDNPFYKLAEHIFAGLSAGYFVGQYGPAVIYSMILDPLLADFWGNLDRLIPLALGLLMFTRLTPIGPIPDISWLSRWGLAIVVGTTAGIFIVSQLHGLVIPQVRDTFLSLDPSLGFVDFLAALLMFLGVVSTLIYFYFSKEHKGFLGATARLGIWFIMVAFGAQFGYTVMARISLLIGRMTFLIDDWIVGSIGALFR